MGNYEGYSFNLREDLFHVHLRFFWNDLKFYMTPRCQNHTELEYSLIENHNNKMKSHSISSVRTMRRFLLGKGKQKNVILNTVERLIFFSKNYHNFCSKDVLTTSLCSAECSLYTFFCLLTHTNRIRIPINYQSFHISNLGT